MDEQATVTVELTVDQMSGLVEAAQYLREREVAYKRNVPKMSKDFGRHAESVEGVIDEAEEEADRREKVAQAS